MKYLVVILLCSGYFLTAAADQPTAPSDAEAVKATVHTLYKSIRFYDYETLQTVVTPGYQLTSGSYRANQIEFEALLRSTEKTFEPEKPLPLYAQYELLDFEIEIAGDVAYSRSTYVDKDPNIDDYYDLIVLRRSGMRWQVHIHFRMPKALQNMTMQ